MKCKVSLAVLVALLLPAVAFANPIRIEFVKIPSPHASNSAQDEMIARSKRVLRRLGVRATFFTSIGRAITSPVASSAEALELHRPLIKSDRITMVLTPPIMQGAVALGGGKASGVCALRASLGIAVARERSSTGASRVVDSGNTLTHELLHLLGVRDHDDSACNLMSTFYCFSDRLTTRVVRQVRGCTGAR